MEFLKETYAEIISSPLNLALVAGIAFLTYKIYKQSMTPPPAPPKPKLKPLEKQDMTLDQLKEFDGTGGEGRVLVAVNGNIFDVTSRKSLYGPGGAYSTFAGKDASRALALFQVNAVKDEYDDLSDITEAQMESVREWEQQFREKYHHVGKLLKPGEKPTVYENEPNDNERAAGNVDKKSD